MESITEVEDETFINGIYGLDNLGNTCYLNSIIQTLANINLFRKFLLDNKYLDFFMHKIDSTNHYENQSFSNLISKSNDSENQNSDLKIKLHKLYDSPIYQFYRLINTIWTGSVDSESLKPTTLKRKLGQKNIMFKLSQQQDAQEAFTILIEMMHMEIAQNISINNDLDTLDPLQKACITFWSKEYSPLYEIFHGMYLNTRICSGCNHISNEYNPNLFLGLDIPLKKTMENLYDSFNITNYIDINCKINSISIESKIKEEMCKLLDEKTINLIKEKHLVISNYNSKYDIYECIQDFCSEKIIEDVKCPGCNNKCTCSSKTELVIPPKVLCVHIKRFGQGCFPSSNLFESNNLNKRNNHITFPIDLDISSILSKNLDSNKYKYKLKSVINHSGASLNFGHYYTSAYSSIHEKWYNFNDDIVMEISESQICTTNAYLLFYEIDN